MKTNEKIIIVGGGLSGLTLAYLLSKKNIETTILEASDRLGGRIQTIKGISDTPLELGATWFSDFHSNLISLLEELNLKKYPQYSRGKSLFQTKSFEPPQEFYVPESQNPSYRIANGTQALIDTLAKKTLFENILLNTEVKSINEIADKVVIAIADGREYKADKVIITIPPQLVASKIKFSPILDNSLVEVLPTVQTWMAGAIKFTLEYSEPFWRNEGYSGMLYSHAGIVTEMYDHTNFEEDKYGFTGFLNGGATSYNQEVRKEFVLRQLGELLGIKALNPIAYFDKIWTDKFVLSGNPIIHRPHQNNGHPLLQKEYLNGKLLFCGTETASEYAGYMEGAIIAAKKITNKIIN
ncbi:flavin monoamine oxidase family protein [Flavobacterium daejeonense]|uniref:flavin monoamine oxidase family protein n=1 Tax=Flavobacterium daejeonense TaxID=350893 RepID=UPI000479D2B3|nr:NAD(P)/FAD-dependent oxidoreductase [Flavobacterium daejeonense]